MRIRPLLGVAGLALLLTSCSTAVSYVGASDPVLAVCQQPDVANVGTLQDTVDNANDTNSWGNHNGQMLTDTDVGNLNRAARSYREYATQAAGHPRLANALRNEAQQFTVAASAPNGLTTNSVAVAADMFSGQIQKSCAAFRVGHAPAAAKAGPGVWDWGLFWFITLGYLLMTAIAGYVIAVGQRTRPRKDRLAPGKILRLSLVWWVSIFGAIGRAWTQFIARATLSPDERKDDRIEAQQKEISRLEKQIRKDK